MFGGLWELCYCVSLDYKAGKACQMCRRLERSVLVGCPWLYVCLVYY